MKFSTFRIWVEEIQWEPPQLVEVVEVTENWSKLGVNVKIARNFLKFYFFQYFWGFHRHQPPHHVHCTSSLMPSRTGCTTCVAWSLVAGGGMERLLHFFDSFRKSWNFRRKVRNFENYLGKTKIKLFLIRLFQKRRTFTFEIFNFRRISEKYYLGEIQIKLFSK